MITSFTSHNHAKGMKVCNHTHLANCHLNLPFQLFILGRFHKGQPVVQTFRKKG